MANSVDEWLSKAAEHEAAVVALLARDAPQAARAMVFHHAGSAVECALKAYIMRAEGLNRWPDRHEPGNYWTHDLRELRLKAGLSIGVKDIHAPAWRVVVQWSRARDYDYSPAPTPMRVAQSYAEAAFGPNGVVTWLKSKLTHRG